MAERSQQELVTPSFTQEQFRYIYKHFTEAFYDFLVSLEEFDSKTHGHLDFSIDKIYKYKINEIIQSFFSYIDTIELPESIDAQEIHAKKIFFKDIAKVNFNLQSYIDSLFFIYDLFSKIKKEKLPAVTRTFMWVESTDVVGEIEEFKAVFSVIAIAGLRSTVGITRNTGGNYPKMNEKISKFANCLYLVGEEVKVCAEKYKEFFSEYSGKLVELVEKNKSTDFVVAELDNLSSLLVDSLQSFSSKHYVSYASERFKELKILAGYFLDFPHAKEIILLQIFHIFEYVAILTENKKYISDFKKGYVLNIAAAITNQHGTASNEVNALIPNEQTYWALGRPIPRQLYDQFLGLVDEFVLNICAIGMQDEVGEVIASHYKSLINFIDSFNQENEKNNKLDPSLHVALFVLKNKQKNKQVFVNFDDIVSEIIFLKKYFCFIDQALLIKLPEFQLEKINEFKTRLGAGNFSVFNSKIKLQVLLKRNAKKILEKYCSQIFDVMAGVETLDQKKLLKLSGLLGSFTSIAEKIKYVFPADSFDAMQTEAKGISSWHNSYITNPCANNEKIHAGLKVYLASFTSRLLNFIADGDQKYLSKNTVHDVQDLCKDPNINEEELHLFWMTKKIDEANFGVVCEKINSLYSELKELIEPQQNKIQTMLGSTVNTLHSLFAHIVLSLEKANSKDYFLMVFSKELNQLQLNTLSIEPDVLVNMRIKVVDIVITVARLLLLRNLSVKNTNSSKFDELLNEIINLCTGSLSALNSHAGTVKDEQKNAIDLELKTMRAELEYLKDKIVQEKLEAAKSIQNEKAISQLSIEREQKEFNLKKAAEEENLTLVQKKNTEKENKLQKDVEALALEKKRLENEQRELSVNKATLEGNQKILEQQQAELDKKTADSNALMQKIIMKEKDIERNVNDLNNIIRSKPCHSLDEECMVTDFGVKKYKQVIDEILQEDADQQGQAINKLLQDVDEQKFNLLVIYFFRLFARNNFGALDKEQLNNIEKRLNFEQNMHEDDENSQDKKVKSNKVMALRSKKYRSEYEKQKGISFKNSEEITKRDSVIFVKYFLKFVKILTEDKPQSDIGKQYANISRLIAIWAEFDLPLEVKANLLWVMFSYFPLDISELFKSLNKMNFEKWDIFFKLLLVEKDNNFYSYCDPDILKTVKGREEQKDTDCNQAIRYLGLIKLLKGVVSADIKYVLKTLLSDALGLSYVSAILEKIKLLNFNPEMRAKLVLEFANIFNELVQVNESKRNPLPLNVDATKKLSYTLCEQFIRCFSELEKNNTYTGLFAITVIDLLRDLGMNMVNEVYDFSIPFDVKMLKNLNKSSDFLADNRLSFVSKNKIDLNNDDVKLFSLCNEIIDKIIQSLMLMSSTSPNDNLISIDLIKRIIILFEFIFQATETGRKFSHKLYNFLLWRVIRPSDAMKDFRCKLVCAIFESGNVSEELCCAKYFYYLKKPDAYMQYNPLNLSEPIKDQNISYNRTDYLRNIVTEYRRFLLQISNINSVFKFTCFLFVKLNSDVVKDSRGRERDRVLENVRQLSDFFIVLAKHGEVLFDNAEKFEELITFFVNEKDKDDLFGMRKILKYEFSNQAAKDTQNTLQSYKNTRTDCNSEKYIAFSHLMINAVCLFMQDEEKFNAGTLKRLLRLFERILGTYKPQKKEWLKRTLADLWRVFASKAEFAILKTKIEILRNVLIELHDDKTLVTQADVEDIINGASPNATPTLSPSNSSEELRSFPRSPNN